MALPAVRLRLIGEGSEIGQDRADPGLRGIGAIAIAAAAVAVLRIPIIGSRLRIRIFDLIVVGGTVAWPWPSVTKVIGGAYHDAVGAGAAHDGLVVIVADRVFLGELGEIGHVADIGVVETQGLEPSPVVASLKPAVAGSLAASPMLTSTQAKRSLRQPLGFHASHERRCSQPVATSGRTGAPGSA